MTTPSLVEDTESHLRLLAAELTAPHERECLLCYVFRMLEHGCTGLRWARHYRDLMAPRATALEERLGRVGGFCDCEVFWNGFQLAPQHWLPERERVEDGVIHVPEATYPETMPHCRGVRRASTRGCALWVRQIRFGR